MTFSTGPASKSPDSAQRPFYLPQQTRRDWFLAAELSDRVFGIHVFRKIADEAL
jgi:hypothetical protein